MMVPILLYRTEMFLDIPKFTNAVTVVGEVRRSKSFVRQDSYKLDDYLELAAGMTARK